MKPRRRSSTTTSHRPSSQRRFGFRSLAATLLWLSVVGLGSASGAEPTSAWDRIAKVRAALASASPLATPFVQSYTPSGFSIPDEESGLLSMSLSESGANECVRWDYSEPFPKGFLICNRIAYSWNPGESSGRRQVLARADSFGLDLLRMSVEELRKGYEATVVEGGNETVHETIKVRLVPTGSAAAEIRDAAIELEAGSHRLVALTYHDVEGNLTRFSLGDYTSVAQPEAAFEPPTGITWLDD